jgi:hypothetical protein
MHYRFEDERLSLRQVAITLDVHEATVWRWTKPPGVGGRVLPTIRVGARRYVLKQDLEIFVAAETSQRMTLDRNQRAEIAGDLLDSLGVRDRTLKPPLRASSKKSSTH